MAPDTPGGSEPLVSVVLPTYDRPAYLLAAVESIQAQTYPRVELIVVDDHSSQPATRTLERARVGTRQRVIRHEQNRGANEARRTGIEHASGSLIAFLDDDDQWLPTKLEKQVERIAADEEVGIVYTGQQYRYRDGRVTGTRIPTTRGEATEAILRGASVGPFSTLLVRADVIESAGRPDPRFPSLQDKEWLVRLSQHARLEPIEEPLVIRHVHGGERISGSYREKRDVTYPLFLEKHRDLAATFGPETERCFVANLSSSVAAAALDAGAYRDAIRFAIRTLRHDPRALDGYVYLFSALGGDYTAATARFLHRRIRLGGDVNR